MDRERGQASVELVAAVPLLLVLGAIAWQLALAGHAAWMSAHAARVAARADVVGRDPRAGARSALPAGLRRGLEVRRLPAGGVRVRVRAPNLLGGRGRAVRVGAATSLGGAVSPGAALSPGAGASSGAATSARSALSPGAATWPRSATAPQAATTQGGGRR